MGRWEKLHPIVFMNLCKKAAEILDDGHESNSDPGQG